jgi:hypothetical protein
MSAVVEEVPVSAFEVDDTGERDAPRVYGEVIWQAPMRVRELMAAEGGTAEIYGETLWYAPMRVRELSAAEVADRN